MYGIHFGIRGCLINILKYKDMNSVEYSPFDGGMIQVDLVSVIEPWYIRKESRFTIKYEHHAEDWRQNAAF